MSDVVVGAGEIDCWREVVPVQHEDRQLTVQVLFRTLKYSTASKEYHIKLTSEEDDCFLYRTVITQEEHRRLMLSHSMSISFDQLPEYFRQLLKSVRHESEYGERYFINVLAQNTPGLAARIELLITMRQSGYVVQNKRLCLPFTLASDSDFKEHLIGCFDKIKKEKEQLRRSVALLETQLREERVRSRELEDKNRWLQKELEFSQGLLKSAENIQKHYESLLHQKHRGEIGGSVLVKIEDSAVGGDGVLSTGLLTGHSQSLSSSSFQSLAADRDSSIQNRGTDEDSSGVEMDEDQGGKRSPLISVDDDNSVAMSSAAGVVGISTQISASMNSTDSEHGARSSPPLTINVLGQPVITSSAATSNSLTASSTSPIDKKILKGAAKRKASFHNYTNQSQNATNGATSTCSATTTTSSGVISGGHSDEKPSEHQQQSHRPPPRKFAAAMVQVDSQLIQIRREQEQQQKKIENDEEDEEAKIIHLSSSDSATAETTTAATSPPPQPLSSTIIQQRQPPTSLASKDIANSLATAEEKSPPASNTPQRPFSHPPVLVPPQTSTPHQPSFAAPPPPPAMPSASPVQVPVQAPIAGHQLPPHLQTSWHHIVSNAPSLPVVSSLHIPMAAAAFAGHHDFVGLGVPPYLLPTISTVTGGVVTPMAPSTAPSTSSYDAMGGPFEDYNNMPDNFARNISDSSDVMNDRMAEEMSSDAWAMIPKSEPNDYQDDRLSDTCSRDSAVVSGLRNGTSSGAGMMMGHRQLMSTMAMNDNSMGGGSESPAPSGAMTGSYSASASPSLSTSSADGIDGVISYLKCLICERSFGQEGAAAHMAQHITDPQRCTICTEMPPFPSKDELIKHMIGHCARAYACRFCGKENPRVHYLKIHVRSHTGEKPYTCLQCGRGFADASTWRRHERVHTGEKPYECTICGRRIARRDNVKIHMRSHMRSKVQMSCRTCGKVFAQPNHLVLHERMCGGGAGGSDLKSGATSSASADIPIVD